MNYTQIIEENISRLRNFTRPYNQITGEGSECIPRNKMYVEELGGDIYLPSDMIKENGWIRLLKNHSSFKDFLENELHIFADDNSVDEITKQFFLLRIKYDFEFWAATSVIIKDKISGADVHFYLNYAQRKLLSKFEDARLHDRPIRIILLKARQWGGSTLTQIYMAWIQLVHKRAWNSVICAHLKDSAANIKGMYAKLLENYPSFLLGAQVRFESFQRMQNTSIIRQTECKVTVGSAETPNSVRGTDVAMAHLSEVAFWPDTKEKKSTDLIRSVSSSVPLIPYSMVVLESTANGVGDYFHTEYNLAKEGKSDKQPLFIPWFEIEMYRIQVKNYKDFIQTFTDYDWFLWNSGATIEAIAWYRTKRKEYQNHSDMMAEYPSDDIEAFAHSGERVFDRNRVQELRKKCVSPIIIGELQSKSYKVSGKESLQQLSLIPDTTGLLKIWAYPSDEKIKRRYIVSVDVGGRSQGADYSVITVIDRCPMIIGGVPEVVATWRGHIDHDLLVWKAAQIATWYQKALLVIESNTLETENTDGEHTQFILDILSGEYSNLYARTDSDKIKEGLPARYGFHTNRSTKTMLIDHMVMLLREGGYIEKDIHACDEYDTYEKKPNGSFGAIEGKHDDILMSRAIGLYVSYSYEFPAEIKPVKNNKKIAISEASF
ncbi:hypothetical protein [Gabonia massiliensis]|uniref:hypothetical protein n=1 Tax=Gabonia massiliensis TaxID=1686296 RepID=UPI0006D8533D|nr:hypothetical protein [Gabonia massiliensis]